MRSREYLTGFSKRKKERTEAARARAVEREKKEKRDLRKQVPPSNLFAPRDEADAVRSQLRETRRGKVEDNVKEQAEYYGSEQKAPCPSALSC